MNDEEEGQSILEFSESIADQEQPPLLPKGKYEGELRQASIEVSKEKGRKYISEVWVIAPESFPADYPAENNPDGLILTNNRTSAEDNAKSRFRIKEHAKSIGVAPPTRTLDVGAWVGARAMLEVDHDTYEGVTREIIKRIVKKT